MSQSKKFWPNGARLAITLSMQFEAGGQPISGAPGPVSDPIQPGYPDLPTNTYFDYGIHEGVPRMLNLFDKHGIKVSSFMIGEAVDKNPALVNEIARRGHECAAHGKYWTSQDPKQRREYSTGFWTKNGWLQLLLDAWQRANPRTTSGTWLYLSH
jgi:peptidoglycan/xylan/chitin deacetylase (PgdA/CDA1 family)